MKKKKIRQVITFQAAAGQQQQKMKFEYHLYSP